MIPLLITSFFIYLFGTFNLIGIHPSFLRNQIFFIIFGAIAIFLVQKIRLKFFRTNAFFFYWLFVGLLVFTFIIGLEVKGSKRWIDLYFFNFQPSEFFKVFFILFLADYYSRTKRHFNRVAYFALSLLYFILPTFIIFKQPDLGNALVYGFIFLVMSLFSNLPKKYFLYLVIIVGVTLPITFSLLHDYQKDRIYSFFNASVDPHGTSYNQTQAIITIGSGQFFGKGLGLGTQSQLYFLPENSTDFAYSALVEQFGFLGGFTVILLYLVMAFLLMRKILKYYYLRDEEGRFKFMFALGVFSFFVFQVFENIGMNLGIMPIAGITLPLISYGGSSVITWMVALALVFDSRS